jgi:hypothetical protein
VAAAEDEHDDGDGEAEREQPHAQVAVFAARGPAGREVRVLGVDGFGRASGESVPALATPRLRMYVASMIVAPRLRALAGVDAVGMLDPFLVGCRMCPSLQRLKRLRPRGP